MAAFLSSPRSVGAESYRDELLIADASSVAVAAAASSLRVGSGPMSYVGVAGILFGSPGVHLAHGNHGRAIGALALRGGSVLVTYGAMIWCLDKGDEGGKVAGCVLGSLALGAVLVGGAFAIDYAVLAADDDADAAPAQFTIGGTF